MRGARAWAGGASETEKNHLPPPSPSIFLSPPGGHASALAAAHPEMHTLVGLDVDPVARATASARLAGVVEARRAAGGGAEAAAGGAFPLSLHIRAANFRTLAAELGAVGCGDADGILLDLGFSSMQASVVWREREKAEAEGRREERGVGCGSARLSISDLFFFFLSSSLQKTPRRSTTPPAALPSPRTAPWTCAWPTRPTPWAPFLPPKS